MCAAEVYNRECGVPAVGDKGEVAKIIDRDAHRTGRL
jgi:hypothetical protein